MAKTESQPTTATEIDSQPTTSVVIPVYNEHGNIRPLFDELREATLALASRFQPVEIIWVEDGSTDGTAALIDDLAADYEGVRAIHLRQQAGQSAALAAGIDRARGEFVVPMDGDRQNDPADIPRLLERLESAGVDCVSGIRRDRDDPLAKRIPSAIQTRLTRRMAPDCGTDMGCTLKAYRASALADVDLRGEQHRYIPAQLATKGYQLDEIDVNHRPRVEGESRYGVGRLVRGFLDALFHLLIVRYQTRPMHLFGGVGLAMLGVGGVLGGHMLVKRLVLFEPIGQHVPRLILVAVLTLGGLLVFGLGILSELLTRLLYREERPYRVEEVVE